MEIHKHGATRVQRTSLTRNRVPSGYGVIYSHKTIWHHTPRLMITTVSKTRVSSWILMCDPESEEGMSHGKNLAW